MAISPARLTKKSQCFGEDQHHLSSHSVISSAESRRLNYLFVRHSVRT
jgi:hypothetical protein